jgi:hypothetical protein
LSANPVRFLIPYASRGLDTPYLLLRCCIESVLNKVPKNAYEGIDLVDDCSEGPEVSDEYLKFLEGDWGQSRRIRVYRLHEHHRADWAAGVLSTSSEAESSFGSGLSIEKILRLRYGKFCGWYVLLDCDAVVLDGALLEVLLQPIRTLPVADKVLVVGDYYTEVPRTGSWVAAADEERQYAHGKVIDRVPKSKEETGMFLMSCALLHSDIQELTQSQFKNTGWPQRQLSLDMWKAGYLIAHAPAYRNGLVLHMGGGVHPHVEGIKRFGLHTEFKNYIGSRAQDDTASSSGYLRLVLHKNDMMSRIRDSYNGLSFDVRGPGITPDMYTAPSS